MYETPSIYDLGASRSEEHDDDPSSCHLRVFLHVVQQRVHARRSEAGRVVFGARRHERNRHELDPGRNGEPNGAQLAKAFGNKVYTTAEGPEKCAACRKLGADVVIDYTKESFFDVIREETKKKCGERRRYYL